ncbi:MAG: beta-propeller fold lactonase family protein [Planctomycetota bacterium]
MRILWALPLLVLTTALAQPSLSLVDSENSGQGPCGIASARIQGRSYLLTGAHLDDTVSTYRVDRNGGLTLADTATLAAGSRPASIGFAYGRYAVVANNGSSDLYVYSVNRNGQLQQVGQPVSSQGVGPTNMDVAATGLVAVTHGTSNEVSTFWLDFRGRLRFLDKAATGATPTDVAIRGTRLVVANAGSGELGVYRLGLRGLEHQSQTFMGVGPIELDLDLSGRNAFVTTGPAVAGGQAQVRSVQIDRQGTVTTVATVDAGLFASGIVLSGREVLVGSVGLGVQNELRVYDRDLNLLSTTTGVGPTPGAITLVADRVGRSRYVFVNEFDNGVTSSYELSR